MAPVTGYTTTQIERGTIGLPRVPAGTSIQFASPSNLVVKPLEPPEPSSSSQKSFGKISGRDLGLIAGGVLAYYFLFRRPSSTATTTLPTTNTQKVPPASTYLPEPSELRQIGATSTTVIVATDPVPGAIRYDWYSYDNNLILARSPTEVAVINGLNPGTPYEIYVVAVGYGGAQSIPSSPLLVKTLPASPFVLVPTGVVTVPPTQPITFPTPTFPGLPTATGPSGVTTAPVVQPVQTSPTPAATAVFKLVSAMVEDMPVQPGQYAYASVTVQNIGDVPGGTTISGNTWNPNGNLAGTWSPEATGVIPPGQSITVTLRSSGPIASPYAIGTPTAPVSRLTATFTASSGGSISTPLVIALPPVQTSATQTNQTAPAQLLATVAQTTQPVAQSATSVPTTTSSLSGSQIEQQIQPYVNAGFKPVQVSSTNGAVKLAPPNPNQPSLIVVPNTPQNNTIQQKLAQPIGSPNGYPTLAAWTAARNAYLGGLNSTGSNVSHGGSTPTPAPTPRVAATGNQYLNVSAGEQYTPSAGGVTVGGIFAPVGSSLYNALTSGGG